MSWSGYNRDFPLKKEDSDSTDSEAESQPGDSNYVLKPGLIHLGIGKNYVPDWTPKDAFREAYQNWKDGIIASFNIDPSTFKPVTQETGTAIAIKAYRNTNGNASPELVGFIHYDKRNGRTQLCNFKARLEAKHLGMGESSKRSSSNLAGTHGEGLKLAALVMRRYGVGVRIESSSFYWNFNFARGDHATLCCNLSSPSAKSLAKKKRAYAVQNCRPAAQRPLTGNMWEDVTLTLSTGKGPSGRKIAEGVFRQWLTVALDLDAPPDGDIIRTVKGDLLFGPGHSARVYLKGLRADGHGPDGRRYKHGYNLATGSIDRDRARLMNQFEEATLIAGIWEQAILKRGDNVTDAYLKLFHEDQRWPDIGFADEVITSRIAKIMWHRLLITSSGVFFYHNDHMVDASFTSQLDPRLMTITFCFVEGGRIHIDLIYEPESQTLRIHEKWTSFDRTHEQSSCEIKAFSDLASTHETEFLCDHVAEDLVGRVLDEVRDPLDLTPTEYENFRQKARSCIYAMPRNITTKATANANELEVCWIGNESGIVFQRYGANMRYLVTLHKSSTCEANKSQLLDETADDPNLLTEAGISDNCPSASSCHCPHQIVNRLDSKAIFSDLDHDEKYFPLVRRLTTPSFYGVPPPALAPRVAALPNGTFTSSVASAHREDDEDMDLYASGDDSDEVASHPQPATSKGTSQSAGGIEGSHSLEDMKSWQSWYTDEMPLVVTLPLTELEMKLSARPDQCSTGGALDCPHLGYTFRRDDLVRIELATPDSSVYFIYIHDIVYQQKESKQPSYSLLVTKYSLFSAFRLLSGNLGASGLPPNSSELLLHFRNYRNMGSEADADAVELDDIKYAEGTPHTHVLYSDGLPQDIKNGDLYCRFGIRTFMTPNNVSITPLASRLLHRPEERQSSAYNEAAPPIVYDMTPNILGPAEGFQQAGCVIDNAFSFDEEHNVTWKTRYPLSSVFDGSVKNTMSDFGSGTLVPPTSSTSDAAKIALFAGEYTCFRLNDENLALPSIEHFFKPFEAVFAATESVLRPGYVVALLSPAFLHPQALPKLSSTISKLLAKRFYIQVKFCRLSEFNIRQDRMVLALVMSRSYTDLRWELTETDSNASHIAAIEAMISDLAITNARSNEHDSSGFLCSVQATSDGDLATNPKVHVYNHYTGDPPCELGVLDKAYMRPFALGPDRKLAHPTLERVLTVREIARLQGFDDDCVFYGSRAVQYLDVLNAIPPAVSKKIAESIVQFIRSSATVTITRMNPVTPRKRARCDDPEDED